MILILSFTFCLLGFVQILTALGKDILCTLLPLHGLELEAGTGNMTLVVVVELQM